MAGGHDTRDEPALIERARSGDARAFEDLLRLHEARVLRVLRLMGVPRDARDDVAQDVFLKIFRGLDGFRRGRPFASWVYKITANAAHDWRASEGRRHRDEAAWPEGLEHRAPEPLRQADDERLDLARRLEAALELLSERERVVFVMVEVEGLDRGEAAHVLGLTQVTIRRHLSLAKERLRSALEAAKKNAPVR